MSFVWIAVTLLGVFGVLNLVVGVSNDAVNFLHAAIGSRVARRRVIYWIAGIGILIGAFLASGMMEVARKGVINPQSFQFAELMVVFLAVMITDIILIDSFNTLRFPTSTTIALVFELLGGALAISFIKSKSSALEAVPVNQLINTDRTFIIIAGLVLSIFLAFIVGIIVQFVTRLFFTFKHRGRFKILSPVLGGVAITAIFFLIFKKAMGGILFDELGLNSWINLYMPEILITILAGTTFLFLFVGLSFNVDIPRLVVFFGTFALALSFAANDLVNFIGVPLTGIESFKLFQESGLSDPSGFSLEFLNDDLIRKDALEDMVHFIVFLGAAIVMIVTLFYSRKAKGVTDTEVHLGRQSVGYERFEPSYLSRIIVRNFLSFHRRVVAGLPVWVTRFMNSRYDRKNLDKTAGSEDGMVYFDTIRAVVNLVVASLLISLGTYLRFPLSTTFVVFMVAMGTSLADQAWGRESAVYRISGVLSILGGWFFTACMAFVGAFVLTLLIWWGGWPIVLTLTGIMGYVLYRTTRYYREQLEEQHHLIEEEQEEVHNSLEWLLTTGGERIRRHLLEASKVYLLSVQGFIDEDKKQLHEACDKALVLEQLASSTKSELFLAFTKLPDDSMDSGYFFVQALDYLTELGESMKNIANPLYAHVDNHHKGLFESQKRDLIALLDETSAFFNYLIHLEKEQRFDLLPDVIKKQTYLISFLEELSMHQIRRIKSGEGRTRVNLIFMEILAETKSMFLYSINLLKAHRDFVKKVKLSLDEDENS
ncbi:phosphate/sulfate permease [Marinilabiliaceae bacterium JC017]|nr:phosphate/sulfate permease [Marinilabiliaceae bacterium JC017]